MGSHFEPLGAAPSAQLSSEHVSDASAGPPRDPARRHLLKGMAAFMTLIGQTDAVHARAPLLGFKSVPATTTDAITLPPGYQAQVLYRWGDATGLNAGLTAGSTEATATFNVANSARDQAAQAGMHHDGMHFFPLDARGHHGLLVVNHEYVDDGLLHEGGMTPWTQDKVLKALAAHGISVIEIRRARDGQWQLVRPSTYARRITGYTPMQMSGPAAGDALLRTADDSSGRLVLGTLNNCGHGYTPWGTYLSCEENWNGYFNGRTTPTPDEVRYGLRPGGFGYRWHEHEPRFDVNAHPNEPNRFGWVVEFNPFDPMDTPIKRTTLGRTKHEGATVTQAKDGRAVIYMGDDERFEYIYKFVSRDPVAPGGYERNRELLDHGTLYVARFDAAGDGAWIALVHGRNGLTSEHGFASQADVLIRCRQAADRVGATRMDRPEWITVQPKSGEVFVTLTNNTERGRPNKAATDAANPREANAFGHIIRWREDGDAGALRFRWRQFVLAGDPDANTAASRGTIKGDGFGSPDGLWMDARGVLWIQTDISTSALGKGAYAGLGNNQMLAGDPVTGETRRFLVGPRGCEVTGVITTPDQRSMFVNIQHPGEPANERSDPRNPLAVSSWPDGTGRPRSATIVISRKDGGIIGT
jgi:uncharacterized protein